MRIVASKKGAYYNKALDEIVDIDSDFPLEDQYIDIIWKSQRTNGEIIWTSFRINKYLAFVAFALFKIESRE